MVSKLLTVLIYPSLL